MEVKTGFAEVNGARLYHEVAGSGDPIVLIHGIFVDCRCWNDQFEVFANEYKVIRYDVRGYGKSSVPVEGEAYSHYDDLEALLEHLGVSKAHIIGWSMGCGFATDFVLAHPERSSSLIAVGPWVGGFTSPLAQEMADEIEELYSIVKESGIKAGLEFLFDSFFPKSACPNPDVYERLTKMVRDFSFWDFINKDPELKLDPPAIQQLDGINLPTLIVTAEHDHESSREIADIMERTIANAKKTDIADAGHFMLMEKPAEFNKIVLDFIADVRVSGV